ncbi:MAG: nucleotide exchange factor GrpE [Culturomica sp.]|nr:nucleotide exchange factor GrpE [Culturomica sp.]
MAKENDLPEEMENVEMPDEGTAQKEADRPGNEEGILEQLEQKLAASNDKYLRLSAEFDNYRKRTLKERMELTKTAGEQILSGILPVVDNLERALDSMKKTDNVQAIREGIELIYASFRDFLAQNGVKEIRCDHEEFDTDFHEAVTKIPAPSKELKGKVVDCIQKGYLLNDKVMRFAKVVVGE